MSNFLQLVQRLDQEVGDKNSGITTVVGQTGKQKRMVDWINSAWKMIQLKHRDWGWMRTSTSFDTVDGTYSYPLGTGAGTCNVTAATFGMWQIDSFRNYVTATGTNSEIFMGPPIQYDTWRNDYLFGALRNTRTRPIQIAFAPDKSVCLGPVPNGNYTLIGDYFTAPVDLSLDADTPSLPAQFHEIIVYRAMMLAGRYESAPEVYQGGKQEYDILMSELEADRMPQMTWAGALA